MARLDALTDWERRPRKFMRVGLAPMLDLAARLGEPQKAFRAVPVGGAKGKGSVSALIEAALVRAGTKVGRWGKLIIEQLPNFPDRVLAFVRKGRVTKADYDSVLVPAVVKAFEKQSAAFTNRLSASSSGRVARRLDWRGPVLESALDLRSQFGGVLVTVYGHSVLNRGFQQFGVRIGRNSHRAIHVARHLAAVNELTSHVDLLAFELVLHNQCRLTQRQPSPAKTAYVKKTASIRLCPSRTKLSRARPNGRRSPEAWLRSAESRVTPPKAPLLRDHNRCECSKPRSSDERPKPFTITAV